MPLRSFYKNISEGCPFVKTLTPVTLVHNSFIIIRPIIHWAADHPFEVGASLCPVHSQSCAATIPTDVRMSSQPPEKRCPRERSRPVSLPPVQPQADRY